MNSFLGFSKIFKEIKSDKKPNGQIIIKLKYKDENYDQIVDDTNLPVSTLKIARLDEKNKLWEILESEVNEEEKFVTATTKQFSIFTILGFDDTITTTDKIIVYPNPFDFSKSDCLIFETGIINCNDASLKIFDIYGRVIKTIEDNVSRINGRFLWDGTNNNNQKVSTGIYTYVLKINETVYRGKFAVVR